ncbi:MAG: penicillin-binding transpeptidase domain-containing protein [Candidatus Paceibacterota bacterium]
MLNRISKRTLPLNWDCICESLVFTDFQKELASAVLKIETYHRSRFFRFFEFLYALLCLLKSYFFKSKLKNITIGHFQIGIITSLKWTNTKVTHLNYFKRIILLRKLFFSVRIFRIGLHFFKKQSSNCNEYNYLDQFAIFYNGTPRSNNRIVSYSEVLKSIVNKKLLSPHKFTSNIKNELNLNKMFDRYERIKGNIEGGDNLCLAVIICDKKNRQVKYSNYLGGEGDNIPVFKQRRSVASTIKIALYACHQEKFGTSLNSIYVDKKLNIRWMGNEITPRNTDNKFRGEVTYEYAFSNSINTIAIQLINELGIKNFVEYLRYHGIHIPMPNTPLLALGAIKLNGWELLSLLSPVIYDGHLMYLSNSVNDPIYDINGSKVLSSNTVLNMQKMLKSVVNNGTGKYLNKNNHQHLGGKTGTSEKNRDLWFMGMIDEQYYGLIWLGMEDESPMVSKDKIPVSATRYAVPLWSDLISSFLK